MTLTPHQQAAFDSLMNFASLDSTAGMAVLSGYAGTGKTFLVGKLISELKQGGVRKLAVAAPTHKALSVLAAKIDTPVDFLTVHSLLGYKMTANEDVKMAERSNPPSLDKFNFVIIDESSMIGAKFFSDIVLHRGWTKVLFVGDPAQLPPIGEPQRSPVFDRVQFQVHLSEVVRQAAENPIIALSMAVRAAHEAGATMDSRAVLSAVPASAFNIGITQREVLGQWALDEHKDGRDCRILAYTNARVLALNADIHEALHGATPTPFVPGERVIVHEARDSVRSADHPGVRVSLRTSEELTVRSVEWQKSSFDRYDLHVVAEMDSGACVCGIWLDEEKQRETQRRFSEARVLTDRQEKRRAFQRAFAFRESFLDLRHAYAMTVHKSQGSTFDTALIDLPDLMRMPPAEFNQALYVAITRPREYLAIGV